jgi:hypothetical protein
LRYFAECAQFTDGLAKCLGALPEFVEQPRVLDGDGGLTGEVRDQGYLLVIERTNFAACKGNRTHQFVLLHHRNVKDCANSAKFDSSTRYLVVLSIV